MSGPARRQTEYLARIIDLYGRLPGVSARARATDQRLVARLRDEGVPVELVEKAMWLTVARRLIRDPNLPPLTPIRSLAYFRPVIEELKHNPPPDSYVDYLKSRVAVEVKDSAGACPKKRVCS